VIRTSQHRADVLAIIDSYLPHAGGSRVYYHNLYKNLVAQFPVGVTVLTKKVPGWQEFDALESQGRLHIVRRGTPLPSTKYQQLPKIAVPLAATLQCVVQERPVLMHAGDLIPPGLVALTFRRSFGIPYIAFCHGEEITQSDHWPRQAMIRNRVYGEAAAVVAASEFARQNLMRIGIPEGRIHKITPGVDCERLQPQPRALDIVQQWGLDGKVVLLTVARLCARKNHQAVIRALPELVEQFPNLCYVIVGRGPEEQALRSLVSELALDGVVKFAGYVPDDRLPDWYRTADIFVMPNREEGNGDVEGFGMVFLEANAVGTPVIGGRSGGTQEAVLDGKTGLLVDPDSVADVRNALSFLLGNTEVRRSMGAAGLRRARDEFSWATRAQMLQDVHRAVLNQQASDLLRMEA
jgi:phosphatidylinositol alpha-1,6-mannosyltransferase